MRGGWPRGAAGLSWDHTLWQGAGRAPGSIARRAVRRASEAGHSDRSSRRRPRPSSHGAARHARNMAAGLDARSRGPWPPQTSASTTEFGNNAGPGHAQGTAGDECQDFIRICGFLRERWSSRLATPEMGRARVGEGSGRSLRGRPRSRHLSVSAWSVSRRGGCPSKRKGGRPVARVHARQ